MAGRIQHRLEAAIRALGLALHGNALGDNAGERTQGRAGG
jgi:hypothetical protein